MKIIYKIKLNRSTAKKSATLADATVSHSVMLAPFSATMPTFILSLLLSSHVLPSTLLSYQEESASSQSSLDLFAFYISFLAPDAGRDPFDVFKFRPCYFSISLRVAMHFLLPTYPCCLLCF